MGIGADGFAQLIGRAIVRLRDEHNDFLGSAFFVTPTVLVTCAHVVGVRARLTGDTTDRSWQSDLRVLDTLGTMGVGEIVGDDLAFLEATHPGMDVVLPWCSDLDERVLRAFSGRLAVAGFLGLDGTAVYGRGRDLRSAVATAIDGFVREGQVDGLAPQGLSGSPLLIEAGDRLLVGGMLIVGGRRAAHAGFLASPTILRHLDERLRLTASSLVLLGPNAATPEQERLKALLETQLLSDGSLPRVRDVDMHDLGVSRVKAGERTTADPYVRRSVDDQLDVALRATRFLLIVGSSKSGKSRTAFELLLRNTPAARVIVPRCDTTAAAVLASLSSDLAPEGVIWLDDLDRYMGHHGLDLQLLRQLQRHDPRITIVATIQSKRRNDLLARPGEAGRRARVVLESAHTYVLDRLATAAELTEAQRLYPLEEFSPDRGIAEQLISAPLLEQRYDDASESHPAGWALVQAVIDWRRVGMIRPISEAALRKLFGLYLASVRPDLDDTNERWRAALKWARAPVAGRLALVERTVDASARAYSAFDYIIARADGSAGAASRAVPAFMWTFALNHASNPELLTIGFEASTRSEPSFAVEALTRVHTSTDDAEERASAAIGLSELEELAGNWDAAQRLLEEAAESGVPDLAWDAGLLRAELALRMGDVVGAHALIDEVLRGAEPEGLPHAQAVLGAILISLGEVDEARRTLERVARCDDPTASAHARSNLSRLLLLEGDYDGALSMLEEVGDSPEVVMLTQLIRAERLAVKDPIHARALLEAAVNTADRRFAPFAQLELGRVLLASGDFEEARCLFEKVEACADPALRQVGRLNGALILAARGDVDGAISQLRKSLDSALPLIVPILQSRLGALLLTRGDLAGATPLLEAAAASGYPLAAVPAQECLAQHALNQGQIGQARTLLERAAASTHASPLAKAILGEILLSSGDVVGARPLLEAAAVSVTEEVATRAQARLATLLLSQGEVGPARALLERATASAHPSPVALLTFGEFLLLEEGDVAAARPLLEAAAASSNPPAVAAAQQRLAALLMDRGDFNAARPLLEASVHSGIPIVVPRAQVLLGALLIRAGEKAAGAKLLETAANQAFGNVPAVQLEIGSLLTTVGFSAMALPLLEEAAVSGDEKVGAIARANMGRAFAANGDFAAARPLLEEAARSIDPKLASLAQTDLGWILAQFGEMAEARRLLTNAAESGHLAVAPVAQLRLGIVLTHSEEFDAAERIFKTAAGSGHPAIAPIAEAHMGTLLLQKGDLRAARPLLESALASGNTDAASVAGVSLGDLLLATGEGAEARRMFEIVISSHDHTAVPGAALEAKIEVGIMLMEAGWASEALPLFEEVLETGYVAPMAQVHLRNALVALGQRDRARDLLERAVSLGYPQLIPPSRHALACLLARDGQLDAARGLLEEVVADSANRFIETAAQVDLGLVLFKTGDVDRAQGVLNRALTSPDRGTALRAHYSLGWILARRGKFAAAREHLAAAAESSDPVFRAGAQSDLAVVLQSLGDVETALSLLNAAAGCPDPATSRLAKENRDLILRKLGKPFPNGSRGPRIRQSLFSRISALVPFVRRRD
jgi:tetratricopeptide (TPR) repeat protein